MSGPFISIVTVCYNSAATIAETLESVKVQTYKNYEYIIIDGDSTDNTLKIISKYKKIITTLVSEPDGGIYEAMNKGVSLARGKWIHILNSDDYYYKKDSLEKAVKLLQDENKFYYFTMIQKYPDHEKIYKWNSKLWKLWYSGYISHPTMLVSKATYEKIGLYNPEFRIAGDHDFILRLIKNNINPVHTDFPFSVMRMGGFSDLSYQRTFHDHMLATIHNGFPKILAYIYYLIKTTRKKIWPDKIIT